MQNYQKKYVFTKKQRMFRANKTPVLKIYTWACTWFSWHLPFLSMFTVYNVLCQLYILYTLYVHIINSKICMPESVFLFQKFHSLNWGEEAESTIIVLLLPGFFAAASWFSLLLPPGSKENFKNIVAFPHRQTFFLHLLTYYLFFWDLKKSSLLWKIFAFKFTSLGHFMF